MEKNITLNHITKIEGHASLNLGIKNGKVTVCELGATEGARYFEGMVVGRTYVEAHEMTSRICGICSSAHVIAAITAIENALQFTPSQQTLDLRALLTLGERIRSHATHLYFLALPDYVGYESALAMAPKFKKELQMALRLIKVGNHMVSLFGGRDLHPVSATVGGWLHLPHQDEIDDLAKQLSAVKKDAIKTATLFMSLTYPRFAGCGTWFSLTDPDRYVVLEGTLTSGEQSYHPDQYLDFIKEHHQAYSNANFVVKEGHRYMVGALPRLNANAHQLSKDAKKILEKSGLTLPSTDPFQNVMAQAVELVHAIDHALDVCKKLNIREEPVAKIQPKAGRGVGCVEAPRGVLFHDYTLDDQGTITKANIITPTAQNLLNIQEDIREFVPGIAKKSKDTIIMEIEKLIRANDPCFSCSAHFLEVQWK